MLARRTVLEAWRDMVDTWTEGLAAGRSKEHLVIPRTQLVDEIEVLIRKLAERQ